MNPIIGSPLTDPTVTVGGETFSVRYSIVAEFKISELGLEPLKLLEGIRHDSRDPHKAFWMYSLFAACVAHNFIAKGLKPLTPEEWMLRVQSLVPELEVNEKLREMCTAVFQAIVKRWPVPKTTAPTPAQDQAEGVKAYPDEPKPVQ